MSRKISSGAKPARPAVSADAWAKEPGTITEAERRKRRDAVDFARASVGLEGFRPGPECEAQAVRFINGEIELADVIGSINEQAQRAC